MKKYMALDFETTSLVPTLASIFQIGAIAFEMQDSGKISNVQVISECVSIDVPIPPKIIELTGLTNDKVDRLSNYQDFKEQFLKIHELFIDPEVTWIGHNIIDYDIPVLRANLAHCNLPDINPVSVVDTMRMFRKVKGSHPEYYRFHANLGTVFQLLCKQEGIPEQSVNNMYLKWLANSYPDLDESLMTTHAHGAGYDAFMSMMCMIFMKDLKLEK